MSTSEPKQRSVSLAGVPLVGADADAVAAGGAAPAVVYHTVPLPGALAPLAAGAEVEFAAVAGVGDVPPAVERPAVIIVRAADAGETEVLRALPEAAVVVAADAAAEAGLRACGRVLRTR
jgi:hypothetical protein